MWLIVNDNFRSLVHRFTSDFLSWLRCSWKSLANHHTKTTFYVYQVNDWHWINIHVSFGIMRFNCRHFIMYICTWCLWSVGVKCIAKSIPTSTHSNSKFVKRNNGILLRCVIGVIRKWSNALWLNGYNILIPDDRDGIDTKLWGAIILALTYRGHGTKSKNPQTNSEVCWLFCQLNPSVDWN